MRDETGDRRIDRNDLLELAHRFGEWMGVELEPIVDPHLVDVLARHVASHYPGRFELWIYDPSFPMEYRAHIGRTFQAELWHPKTVARVSSIPSTIYSGYGYVELESRRLATWNPVDLVFIPSSVVAYTGEGIISVRLAFDPSLCGQTVELECGIRSYTSDPDPDNNGGILRMPVLPCEQAGSDADGPKPNLWVTDVPGCWELTNTWEMTRQGDERRIAEFRISGIVRNGGQADAMGVRAQVCAGRTVRRSGRRLGRRDVSTGRPGNDPRRRTEDGTRADGAGTR